MDSAPIRILLLEDNDSDAELIRRAIREAGLVALDRRVSSRESFLDAIKHFNPDIILSDYSMPTFNGISALDISRELSPGVPFIFVSGTIMEETAVEALRHGAYDYILKDRPARLGPAVKRALEEAKRKHDVETLEEQLRRAQKMESLGELSGGIAHDFNNVLGIILGYTSMMHNNPGNVLKQKEGLDAIMKASKRGTSLVSQLMTFARKSPVTFQRLNVNDIINELTAMVNTTFPKDITCECSLSKEVPDIMADGSQLHQAILNLCVNARDAMPTGGEISITTCLISPAVLAKKVANVKAVNYIEIHVKDTGHGMDEATCQRIFEPFFTTKAEGKGTGLGLSVTYGVIKAHKGVVLVHSKVGEGTSFHLYFPVVGASQPDLVAETSAITTLKRGSGVILVVEDEPMLAELVSGILTTHGHRVILAKTGFEAIAAYRKHSDEIDVVFSDIWLPEVDGREAVEVMRQLNPRLRVIFTTGFIDMKEHEQLFQKGANGVLMKPYTAQELLESIQAILEDAGT